ncbi:hypothetical protein RBSWK_05989 [Rhodopirellula baltica SWK14]|uniref:Uncharacterized protein n=1 Tax=Rhodopirellula baltica SWK14 TaxID=993516 RepID=L7C7U1_RHOBT|nr:hypothetical protein RBSWK_05989 [Rhodopirellula baltica SWK14]
MANVGRSGSFGQLQNEKRHVREILARAFFDDSLHRLERPSRHSKTVS